MNTIQIIKQRYSKTAITLSLFLIIFGYCANNLIWTTRSPIYFYRDSIANIQWAVYYGKFIRGENLLYEPELFNVLKNKNIEIDSMIYYQEYSEIFKGPLIAKKKIDIKDLLRFHHPPLWFVFLGSLFAIFGFKAWVVYFMQTFLGALTIWLTYLLGKKICFSSLGLFSAFALSTLPSFLIITRQGFLEAMICPVVLISIIFVYRLLEKPSKRLNYIIFGFICGLGMLIKSTFIVSIILLSLIDFIFVDRKKNKIDGFFKNWLLSFIVMMLIILPWYAYAYKPFLNYFMAGLYKGKGKFLFDMRNVLDILPVLKNAQLGSFLFFLFIIAILSFSINLKAKKVIYLVFFLILGYFVIILMPFPFIIRHLVYFLPIMVIFICYGVIKIPCLKYYIITSMMIFSFICGYGWFIPKLLQADSMNYIYDDIGISKLRKEKYSIYATDIKSGHLFSLFLPLPQMKQRAVYEKIKTMSPLHSLRLIKIAGQDDYALEKNTLAGALSLYSIFEGLPLIIENAAEKTVMHFKGRIWIFLRNVNKDINFSDKSNMEVERIYTETVFLLPDVACDIFEEK